MKCRNDCALLFLVMACAGLVAQTLRDPTLPPPQARPIVPEATGKASSPSLAALTIIVRDGRTYLAVGTRLYAQGEKLGEARIERITETEVWLREGSELRKIAQFQGIARGESSVVKEGVKRFSLPALDSRMPIDPNNSKNPPHD